MNYHNILHNDMLNGNGLRVVLFVSGCSHQCKNCQNPQTWDCDSGIEFDSKAKDEIFEQLSKDYIKGITFSGGDPLHENNLEDVLSLIHTIRFEFPNKDIWLYTGYIYEEIIKDETDNISAMYRKQIIENIDVLIDGKYVEELKDNNYKWCGSTNQRVIDVKKSFEQNKFILLTT